MKINIKYTVLFCFFISVSFSQTKQFNLSKGNCQLYGGRLYSFGIASQKQNVNLLIYKLNLQLKIEDSLTVDLGKATVENFLQVFSDTLHNYLNIYVQRKDKKLVTILRFNKLFERVATIEDVDVARLNSISTFEKEIFYFKNDVFSIKDQIDTSGKQFYLNKFSLKSDQKNFDYEFKWQFPFERKNINSAHIFYADSNKILLYVNVSGGSKIGQWILKVNSKTGKLIRGTKLNDKGETNSYQFGSYLMDTSKKTISVIGQRFTQSQFDQKTNKLAISNAPFVSIYLIEIDSAAEIVSKQDFKIPVNEPKTVSKKVISNYVVRINALNKNKDGSYTFETDIYKNTDNTLCYLYGNTSVFHLVLTDDETLMLEKAGVASNPMIEKYYFNTDKMDMNGKLCIDSLSEFETFYYSMPNFPIKKQFKLLDNNSVWLLTRSDLKKNSINYSVLSPVKNIYQLTTKGEVAKSKDPGIIVLTNDRFIISTQEEPEKFELKVGEW